MANNFELIGGDFSSSAYFNNMPNIVKNCLNLAIDELENEL